MTVEEKLNGLVNYYRQKLADEQLLSANLSVKIDELKELVKHLEEELKEYRVQEEAEPGRTGITNCA